ncbi:PAS domain-containing sensor histidine kinase [Bacillus sp. T33-2]|uniref:PAS domain-containing sensor histidine kinase n=1 Tax=Bacillus sp. T33-2 TaxID=2054168 RepID=UPI000C7953E6|nr:PAS domain S-box protein [Bacillus sp. T33-2]PLR98447.1 histidine kinase [Bacillus sp. T33-2]
MEKATPINWEFEMITQHALDILLIVDKNQNIMFVTPSFELVLGYNPDEALGTNAFDAVHPDDREFMMEAHRKVMITEQPLTNEYRVFHKNGDLKYFESRVMPVPDHPDRLVVVSIRDITIRKSMETEIKKRKNRYEELQNSLKSFSRDLSSVLKIADMEARLLNEIKTVLPGSEPEILLFNRKQQNIEEDSLSELEPVFPQLIIGKLIYMEDRILIRIGDRNDLSYVLSLNVSSVSESMDLIWVETFVYYAVMVFESLNVIENLLKQLESALDKNERPQWILRLLFNLSEKQRLQLSSDLHDTVLLDQIDLYRGLEALLEKSEFNKEMKEDLGGVVRGLLDTIHQIRTTCNELRPPLLREIGLERALENLFDYTQVSSTYKITFRTDNTTGLSLGEEKTIGLYRIVQELLNNATKHSQAMNLHFFMKKTNDTLMLEYIDDGKGFETEKLNPSFNSMGLSSMRERVQSLDGRIEIISQPGTGVRVVIHMPIHGIDFV